MTNENLDNERIQITKQIHPIWNDYNIINLERERVGVQPLKPIIGKYQYIYADTVTGNEISIIELPDYFNDGMDWWEIYCVRGNLFDDVKRFASLNEAIHKTLTYLYNQHKN